MVQRCPSLADAGPKAAHAPTHSARGQCPIKDRAQGNLNLKQTLRPGVEFLSTEKVLRCPSLADRDGPKAAHPPYTLGPVSNQGPESRARQLEANPARFKLMRFGGFPRSKDAETRWPLAGDVETELYVLAPCRAACQEHARENGTLLSTHHRSLYCQ